MARGNPYGGLSHRTARSQAMQRAAKRLLLQQRIEREWPLARRQRLCSYLEDSPDSLGDRAALRRAARALRLTEREANEGWAAVCWAMGEQYLPTGR